MIIHKCDVCGKEERDKKGNPYPSSPKGWFVLQYDRGRHITTAKYDLCDICRKKLNIPEDFYKAHEQVGERLIEILSEIAEQAISQAEKV